MQTEADAQEKIEAQVDEEVTENDQELEVSLEPTLALATFHFSFLDISSTLVVVHELSQPYPFSHTDMCF